MDSVDFGRALKAPFNDKGWPGKTALGFLWILLWVTSPVLYGAQLDYIMRVSNGNEELPDWSDFGGKWVRGFLVSLAGFIYFLPVIILGVVMYVPALISAIASGGDSSALGGLLAGGSCLFGLIATVYIVAVSVLFYAAMVHYAVKGTFGAFFQFSEILAHVKDGTGYFAAWLWSLVIGFGLGVVMSVVSGVTGGLLGIIYPAAIYLMTMMTGHLFGQWAAKSYGLPGLGSGVPVYAAPAAPGGYAPPPPPAYTPPAPPAQPAPPAAPQGYEAPAAPPAYAPPAPPAYEPPAPAPVAPVAPEAPAYAPPAPAPAPVAEPPAPPAPDAAFAPPADTEPPAQ